MMTIFGECRGFTKEEAKAYTKVLNKISTPTGRNFYDLLDGGDNNEQNDESNKQNRTSFRNETSEPTR